MVSSPQIKDDPDLKKLLKLGFLKRIRMHTNRYHARTYLVKT
jgi:transposase